MSMRISPALKTAMQQVVKVAIGIIVALALVILVYKVCILLFVLGVLLFVGLYFWHVAIVILISLPFAAPHVRFWVDEDKD